MATEELKGTQAKIRVFEARKEALMNMGGEKMIAKQHELGKLTARERLDRFFDPGTFQEVQLFVKHRSPLFGLDKKEINADGVIVGFGKVGGRTVFAAAQILPVPEAASAKCMPGRFGRSWTWPSTRGNPSYP